MNHLGHPCQCKRWVIGYGAMGHIDDDIALHTPAECFSPAHTAQLRTLLSPPSTSSLPELNPENCDPVVFKDGDSVALVPISKNIAQKICQELIRYTGWKWDWHFAAGYAHIKCLRTDGPSKEVNCGNRACEHHGIHTPGFHGPA